MWQSHGRLRFLQHPQLWLIPVALSVLLAAYLNEDRLTEDQMTGVRYLSLVTIYVSSTADIFINGVANSPWLPLILGSFSLAGVFAGIVFRIRGLLLLGVDLSVAVDHHDDLVRVDEFRLDVAVVRRRNCDRSDDHLHVRGV